jgi:enamine deaminase RidA (YjgF/YER057c/UK114 family)
MSIESKLKTLGIALPEPPAPVGSYVPSVRTGNLLFLSGMIPFRQGKLVFEGKVGRELSVEEGQEAARLSLLNALAVVRHSLGSLDHVKRIVRLSGHVASAPGFYQQPLVLNGASDLLVQIFEERGYHSRLALGASELPLNAPIELDLIIEIEGGGD